MNAMQKLKHECNATTLHPSLPPRLNYKTKLDLDSILDSNTTKQNTQRMAPHATHPGIPNNTEP